MNDANGFTTSSEMISFHIKKEASRAGPRVGELFAGGRPGIPTPSFIASTSRGVIPHITPDLVQKKTAISITYFGLEDFLEKSRTDAPIFHVPQDLAVNGSILRTYTGLPQPNLSILGARRVPRLSTPHHNSNSALAISTSFGFASLEVEDYNKSTRTLKPDVIVTAVDLVQEDKKSRRRVEKSADRTHAWLRDTLAETEKFQINTPLFASIPPLEPEQQSFYLSDLADEFESQLSGICVYEEATATIVPESLRRLPVLCLSDPKTPQDLLKAVALGVDLITIPFVTNTSEAGIALTFELVPSGDVENEPLGVDMWSTEYATDLSPLAPYCTCYTCTRHHRAYLHHLLQAKEMLAWSLLQIHNFHVVNQFFQHIRESLVRGSFEQDSEAFRVAYETEMPQRTGQGPRIRGYQIRSLGPGEKKKNSKAYNKLEDQARKIEELESGIATLTPDEDAEVLESQGFGQQVDKI